MTIATVSQFYVVKLHNECETAGGFMRGHIFWLLTVLFSRHFSLSDSLDLKFCKKCLFFLIILEFEVLKSPCKGEKFPDFVSLEGGSECTKSCSSDCSFPSCSLVHLLTCVTTFMCKFVLISFLMLISRTQNINKVVFD